MPPKEYPDFITSTGYGTGAGLCGWNCRHHFHPFFPGISERTYTDEELANIDPPPIKETLINACLRQSRWIFRLTRKVLAGILLYFKGF